MLAVECSRNSLFKFKQRLIKANLQCVIYIANIIKLKSLFLFERVNLRNNLSDSKKYTLPFTTLKLDLQPFYMTPRLLCSRSKHH